MSWYPSSVSWKRHSHIGSITIGSPEWCCARVRVCPWATSCTTDGSRCLQVIFMLNLPVTLQTYVCKEFRGLQAKDSLQEVCRPMYLEKFAPSCVPEKLKSWKIFLRVQFVVTTTWDYVVAIVSVRPSVRPSSAPIKKKPKCFCDSIFQKYVSRPSAHMSARPDECARPSVRPPVRPSVRPSSMQHSEYWRPSLSECFISI